MKETFEIDKFDLYRKHWLDYLLGRNLDMKEESNDQDIKEYISSIQRIADMKENCFITPYCHPRALAMAYKTPGTTYYKSTETFEQILSLMDSLYNTNYNLSTSPDNWWQVEIGHPLRILDILILLYDELPDRDNLITKYTDVILHFKDAYRLSSKNNPETGANLVWKCNILLLVGILRKSQELIDWANEQLPTVLKYSDTISIPGVGTIYDDGFYKDGSFIQHYFFAYIGGYGKHMINILSSMLYAFEGTDALTLSQSSKDFLYKMVFDAYEPVIYNGRFMDMVRGREPSRGYYEDFVAGRHVIRSLSLLSTTMPSDIKVRAESMIKEWLLQNNTENQIYVDESVNQEYFIQGSHISSLRYILSNNVTPRGNLLLHKTYGVVSKVVHLAKRFGLGLSMYSPTIAGYEFLNGESNKFWHMADGVTYIYTSDADQYNGNFYATVDMQRLPGTTVDRSPSRESDPYYIWYLPESKNVYAFSGGTDLAGLYGIAGLQYRGQGNGKERDLEVKKSWFMFDDEVVALGSGITSTTGNPIETIIDNRRLLTNGDNLVTMDKSPEQLCNQVINGQHHVHTIHLSGNCGRESDIGCYFPGGSIVHTLYEHREGSWSDIGVNSEEICENDYMTLWINHGNKPVDDKYSYVILPGISASETIEYSKNPTIEIIEHNNSAHAVLEKKQNILGINFWNQEPYTCSGISCSTQACVMIQHANQVKNISVSDPTKTNQIIEVSFDFNISSVISCDESITITNLSPLHIRIDTTNAHGQSFSLKVAQ